MASLIKNFFSKNELQILQKYCYNKLDASQDWVLDRTSFSPAWYYDSLMTALLDIKLPGGIMYLVLLYLIMLIDPLVKYL